MKSKPIVETISDMRGLARALAAAGRVLQKSVADNRSPTPKEKVFLEDFDSLERLSAELAMGALAAYARAAPTFMFFSKYGDPVPFILETMPRERSIQYMLSTALALFLRVYPAEAYVFFAEVWLASETPPNGVPDDLVPSERPDRREAVVVRVATRLHSTMKMYFIKRDAAGKPIALEPAPEYEEDGDGRHVDPSLNPLMSNLYLYDLNLGATSSPPVQPTRN